MHINRKAITFFFAEPSLKTKIRAYFPSTTRGGKGLGKWTPKYSVVSYKHE